MTDTSSPARHHARMGDPHTSLIERKRLARNIRIAIQMLGRMADRLDEEDTATLEALSSSSPLHTGDDTEFGAMFKILNASEDQTVQVVVTEAVLKIPVKDLRTPDKLCLRMKGTLEEGVLSMTLDKEPTKA